MPRIAKDPQERRNEILDAAMELFHTKGYEHTSVSDIVKKVGVAQGTFYYYFRSKEEIATAAHERSLASRLDFVKKVVEEQGLPAVDKLRKVLLEGFPAPPKDQAILDYLHADSNSVLHQQWLVAKITAFNPYLTEIVRQGVDEGVFQLEQPAEVTEFLLVGISFLFDRGIFGWSDEELENKLRALEGIIDRLLGGKHIISADELLGINQR
ncbi:TetR/AcrR family transcriptional regulator [Paenibacillus mucilaginosus]|uniref:TetR family transcriptional regulator n=1 Tax=Paenibacillus mucilaginosus (strain KNP414) TaxID=1036673 RepID=F8FN79_PAEMK|nr:TetR/AcrR family transcriptional regulator [Paenibacillus mucilaginosus]AEI45749.1 TetR family transcriptional regulator [Paenibacillus mucilaginosus KNP414]MCG7215065.1 TetR/AcrR family transcriptional regulator [Paenibacillus mucilaginosus]WDM27130.1 TetR/AcrR family transcriptional regulator [Paenibacillus mucilaginosus]